MNKFVKANPCSVPLLFLILYGVLILAIVPFYSPSLFYASRLVGLIAFINVFTQVMLGVFRSFFNEHYNPKKVFLFHNIVGLITLILSFAHVIMVMMFSGFNALLSINFGILTGSFALGLMTLSVISSDLKFFFKIKINESLWRLLHYFNYMLFPLLLIHELMIGLLSKNYIALIALIVCLLYVIIGIIYKLASFFVSK